MSTFTGGIEQLEAALAEMGQGMIYPSTPNFVPAVLARVDTAERRPRLLPALWPVTPQLVIILILALLLLACSAVAAYFLYPVPKGFDISVSLPGTEGGGSDVFMITADDLEQLTSNSATDIQATWAPDCSRIAFASNRPGFSPNYDIYMMNPDGTGVVTVVDSPGVDMHPNWSPDGTRLVFNHDDVHWEPGPFGGGRWRANGEPDLYVVNVDGSGLTRLTDLPGLKVVADWSPDGRRILFGGGQQDNSEIYVITVDGTGLRNLTNYPAQDDHARWSPDGTRIVFASNREQIEEFGPANRWYWPGGGLDIYVMDADGGNVTRLTDHPENDILPHWSPDGKWISFTSARISGLGGAYEGGPWDVYVMKGDGSDLQHVIQGTGHGWSSCKAQR